MKKTMILTAAACAALMAGISCSKMEQPQSSAESSETQAGEGTYTVTFNCSMDDETKTGFDDDKGIEWKKADKISFLQVYYDAPEATSTSIKGVNYKVESDDLNVEANITSFPKPDLSNNHKVWYFAVYPSDNLKSYLGFTSGRRIPRVTLPHLQNPSAVSFDPISDILLGEYLTLTEVKESLHLRFERMCAIGKMTIKNLPSQNAIASIVFSAKGKGEDAVLAGSTYYNFTDVKEGYTQYYKAGTTTEETELTLNYTAAQNITANTEDGMKAYFCCYPFELGAGDSFKVIVKTHAGEVFTREVQLPTGRELIFSRGKGTTFSVDMSTAEKWFDVLRLKTSEYTSSNFTLAYGVTSKTKTVTSLKHKCVLASEYQEAVVAGTVDELYSEMKSASESAINNINGGKSQAFLAGPESYVPDADYYVLIEISDSSKGTVRTAAKAHSDSFGFLTASSSTIGKFSHKFWGANIGSIQYLAVESSAIEGTLNNTNCKKYFDDHKTEAISISSGTITNINDNGANGYGYLTISKTFAAGAECVDLVLATMTDGSTKFCWKTQEAKK